MIARMLGGYTHIGDNGKHSVAVILYYYNAM